MDKNASGLFWKPNHLLNLDLFTPPGGSAVLMYVDLLIYPPTKEIYEQMATKQVYRNWSEDVLLTWSLSPIQTTHYETSFLDMMGHCRQTHYAEIEAFTPWELSHHAYENGPFCGIVQEADEDQYPLRYQVPKVSLFIRHVLVFLMVLLMLSEMCLHSWSKPLR